MSSLFWTTLLAFGMAVAFCIGFRGLAREWYLIDTPNVRKRHDGDIPLCGGIAIFLSCLISIVFAPSMPGSANAVMLLPGLFLILVTGVLDDRFDLPVAPRLAIQLFAGLLIIAMVGLKQIHLGLSPNFSENTSTSPSDFLGEVLTGPVFLLLAVTFIVGLVNAVNMSDGIDGLAGSSSAAAFFWLAMISFNAGENRLGLQTIIFSSACIGFLIFNMRHRFRTKASLFLGDGGSTLLGAALAGIILILVNTNASLAFPVLLWIVALPVIDTLSLIFRRLLARKSPFTPDRQHLHHLLLDSGFSPGQAAFVISSFNFGAGAVAYAAIAMNIPSWTMLIGLILLVSAHSLFVLRTNRGLHPVGAVTIAETAQTSKPNITYPGATS
jgi:UDP-GlcNAc:undecaprenyl-phosphate/decaprenyl-phosphate GlcNAc-1-phosphate transferase